MHAAATRATPSRYSRGRLVSPTPEAGRRRRGKAGHAGTAIHGGSRGGSSARGEEGRSCAGMGRFRRSHVGRSAVAGEARAMALHHPQAPRGEAKRARGHRLKGRSRECCSGFRGQLPRCPRAGLKGPCCSRGRHPRSLCDSYWARLPRPAGCVKPACEARRSRVTCMRLNWFRSRELRVEVAKSHQLGALTRGAPEWLQAGSV